MNAFDKQENGDHYIKLPIQPMQYSLSNNLNAAQHTAIKYITRYNDKGGLKDLRKAIHTIELLIEHETEMRKVSDLRHLPEDPTLTLG